MLTGRRWIIWGIVTLAVAILMFLAVLSAAVVDAVVGDDIGDEKDLVDPIWAYEHPDHGAGSGAVIGGHVYRGAEFPSLSGKYVYSDFQQGTIWTLTNESGTWKNEVLFESLDNAPLGRKISISSFGETEDSELVMVDNFEGVIYEFVDQGGAMVPDFAYPNITFEHPVGWEMVPDGSGRVFIPEQDGRVFSFDGSDRDTNETELFLDIDDQVLSADWEQGLLGFTFHPDFSTNSWFYAAYTSDPSGSMRLSRFTDTGDPVTRAASEEILLEVEEEYRNHNGGNILFGPDGYLYFGLGDGGLYNDAWNNAQNRETLKGSLLRLDMDNSDPAGVLDYGIPPGNPYVGNDEGFREEIWAYGLRNPWKFSFDPVTQELFLGDVGQDHIEEINIIVAGGNYGWAYREGDQCFDSPFPHYDGHSCDVTDRTFTFTIWMWLYERVLLNIPLMAAMVVVWVASSTTLLIWLKNKPAPGTEEE